MSGSSPLLPHRLAAPLVTQSVLDSGTNAAGGHGHSHRTLPANRSEKSDKTEKENARLSALPTASPPWAQSSCKQGSSELTWTQTVTCGARPCRNPFLPA